MGVAIAGQHGLKVGFLLHPVHPDPHQHPVVERFQPAVRCRQLVGGSHQQAHRDGVLAVSVAKLPLVDGGEQGVEDGGTCLPDLVEEHHLSLWQITCGEAQIFAILFQRLNGEGAEHLLRRTETGHQVFKVAGVVKGQLEAAGNQALGNTGWPQQEDTLTAEGRQQTEAQSILPFVESLTEGGQQPGQALLDGNKTRRVLGLS